MKRIKQDIPIMSNYSYKLFHKIPTKIRQQYVISVGNRMVHDPVTNFERSIFTEFLAETSKQVQEEFRLVFNSSGESIMQYLEENN